ncbi:MAG: FtsX-like permease family protein [Candidatus Aenigmarchaeota archaeon]|nr:FtsX-like permease family protein [Candidatus Aminicenantes bacterium]NIN91628.1 FtsX-like permease family protein [bacterium]NIO19666.1 FtsX-like permease family protein [Candidatus Aenigmarchaeota archaeon]
MIKNYLKIAFRNVRRHKAYSFINIAGLTIGMTCVVLLLLWIQDELSYDKFHEKIDDIYLVSAHIKTERDGLQVPSVPGVGPLLKELFPEVEESARFLAGYRTFILSYQDKTFSEPRVFPADPEVLEMFTFPLIEGDQKTALKEPNSLVLSERVSKKYFGEESPIGKVITVDNQHRMKVMGVMKEVPSNSTFRFNILMPLEFYCRKYHKEYDLNGFSNQNYFVFAQLQKGSSFSDLNTKIKDFVVETYSNDEYVPVLRPFARFHLYRLDEGGGSIEQIRLVGFLAAFILLIACINFMNLTTARSGNRSREIGMRKVIGAFQKDIIKQFYFETSLFVLISMVLTVFLAELFLPVFNTLFRKELTLSFFQNPSLLGFLIGTSLITALVAGSYPALLMSSFQPIRIIKGFSGSSLKRAGFRKALVVVQFTLAIGLIAYAAGIYKQLNYLQTMDLGYNMENIVFFSTRGELLKRCETAKSEFLQIPGVEKVTAASAYLTGGRSNSSSWQWEGKDPEFKSNITFMSVDSDFLETFEIPLVKGRFFHRENDYSGNPGEILINEKLAGIMGKEDPIGVGMSYSGQDYTVIGVIKDYLPNPRWRVDEPLVLLQTPERYRYIFLKIHPENIPQTLAQVKIIFERLNPGFPFEYEFMDNDYEIQFSFVRRTRSLIAYFAGFAIFISCLGLFGLASFNAEQRTKEIGIRKVLGSSVSRIVMLLSKDLTKLVLLANIIAWPVAWLLLDRWLQSFLYRTHINLDIFIIAGALTLIIALFTVSYHSIKAATANPVDSLRYE